MKLCLMILSVPWYMLNGLEHAAIMSHFLTCITLIGFELVEYELEKVRVERFWTKLVSNINKSSE